MAINTKRIWIAVISLFWAPLMLAQEGQIQIGYDTYYEQGDAQTFQNQYHPQDGIYLGKLKLDLASERSKLDFFTISASGFGNHPQQRAQFKLGNKDGWEFGGSYQRREFNFFSPYYETGHRTDDWDREEASLYLAFNGFDKLKVQIEAKRSKREGIMTRSFFGLGLPYLLTNQFEEVGDELSLSLKTKNLPVRLWLEHSLIDFKNQRKWTPGPSLVEDPDSLTQADSPTSDSRDTPRTRFGIAFENDRLAMELKGIKVSGDMQIDRADYLQYDLGTAYGDPIGQMQFRYWAQGETIREKDSYEGAFGVKLSDSFKLRLRSHYHRRVSENDFLELFQLTTGSDPFWLVLDQERLDRSAWTQKTTRIMPELEYERRKTQLVLAWGQNERQITHDTVEHSSTVERESDTLKIQLRQRFQDRLKLKLSYQQGDFTEFIFNTDPEKVDRTKVDLSWKTEGGWNMQAKAMRETAENPQSIAGLDREQTQYTLSCSRSFESGFIHVGLNQYDFQSIVNLGMEPNAELGPSMFDSDFRFLSVTTQWNLGERSTLALSSSYGEDRGATTPFRQFRASSRLQFEGPAKTVHAFHLDFWSYSNRVLEETDYDMMRIGYLLGWRF